MTIMDALGDADCILAFFRRLFMGIPSIDFLAGFTTGKLSHCTVRIISARCRRCRLLEVSPQDFFLHRYCGAHTNKCLAKYPG